MAFPRVVVGQNIRCSILLKDGTGIPVDPDLYVEDLEILDTTAEPYAKIYDANENMILEVWANAINRESAGMFYYNYVVSSDAIIGTYRVRWYAHIGGYPLIYDDYFQVTAHPTAISDTIIARIKREMKDLSTELDDLEYENVQMDAEADVMDVSPFGLAWHNKWEILWLTKRGVRHCLQRILNNWLDKFTIGKAGKSLALSDPSRAIMQRITMIDTEFEKAKETRYFDGVHWTYRPSMSAITSVTQVMDYKVDPFTGSDETPQYDASGNLRNPYDDDESDWWSN